MKTVLPNSTLNNKDTLQVTHTAGVVNSSTITSTEKYKEIVETYNYLLKVLYK